MEVETKNLPTRAVRYSLIGTGNARPVSWGNYFWLADGAVAVRVMNMWMENLDAASDQYLDGGEVRARIYRDGGEAWCLIDDDRIPQNYYYNKLCFTGGTKPTLDVARDAYAHVGDPDYELEQFIDPAAYWKKRGGEYDARGFVHMNIGPRTAGQERSPMSDNMMAVPGLDTSDAAAYALLVKIAEKAVEPMSSEGDPNKTLGECRKELTDLLFQAVQFVATRNNTR